MLRALFDAGVVPDLVVGTSVGALNGVLVAAQPAPPVVDRLARLWTSREAAAVYGGSTPRRLARFARSGTHLHSPWPLRRMLEAELAGRGFADLAVPFQCCAASIERAAEHWFADGPLVDAVLASCAVPGLLPPVCIDGEHYVDGGIVNSIPVGRAVELGARTVYVMQVGRIDRPLRAPRRPWEVARVAFEIARRHRYAREMASLPDGVVVHVLPAALLAPLIPGRLRLLRVAWLGLVYLLLQAVAMLALLGLWLATGFGHSIRSPWSQRTHYQLTGWYLRVMYGEARRVLRLRIVVDGPDPDAYPGHPLLVLSRHAGPGDSLVLVHALVNWYAREPRIVLKDSLQWHPAAPAAGDLAAARARARKDGRPGHRDAPRAGTPAGRRGGGARLRTPGRRHVRRARGARPPDHGGRHVARDPHRQNHHDALVAGTGHGGPTAARGADRLALRLVETYRRLDRQPPAPHRLAG